MEHKHNLSVINDLLPVLTDGNTGVWVCDISTGLLVFKNNFFEILGLTQCDVKFSSIEELKTFIHADDLLAFEQAFVAASAGKNTSVTWRLCSEDNQIQLESSLIFCGDSVVACTIKKDPMLQLSLLEKQYKALVNTLFPSFIFVFDENFFFEDIIMPDGLKLFHSREQLIGTDGRNLYSPEVSELFISNIQECLKNNQWKEIEYSIDLLETRYYYHTRIVPVENNRVFCLNTDIGDRLRRIEELLAQRRRAEESDKMKSAFIANMSHEIKSPLNTIINFTEHLIKNETPQKQQEYLDTIYSNNKILLEIINNIIELSRIESGISEFHFDKTNIAALVKDIAKFHTQNMKPAVRLQIDIPAKDIQVFTDAGRVKQVLNKLVSNAMQHTERGSITLKVEEGSEYLTFSVADTGCGIPENKLETIFNRFEKFNHFAQGVGLGLAICKTIVERLGGSVALTSKVNEGSLFSFTIPYQYIASKKENIGSVRIASDRRKKILLAESSETDLKFISKALENKYDVVEVTDYEKIINAFILDNPNLILLSMEMIGKTDMIKKIRAMSNTTPIILMTTSDFYHDQKWAIENGCTDAIVKPFSSSNIEELVTTFIV